MIERRPPAGATAPVLAQSRARGGERIAPFIDGGFDAAAAGGVVFHAATGIDADAIAEVQACVRRRLLRVFVRRGLLPGNDAQGIGQWEHGGGFSVDGSVRIEAADRA